MGYGYNTIVVYGRAINDAASTGKVVKFSIAEADNISGESNIHTVACFGKIGEFAEKWVKRGNIYLVRGYLKYGKFFSRKDGLEVRTVDIFADQIKYGIGSKQIVNGIDAVTEEVVTKEIYELNKELNECEEK